MQKLRLYNSLTKKKDTFRPSSSTVGMYVCGITPYSVTHLGHVFTYTFFDVLARYLDYLSYKVTYVQNVTDIDDDILRQAREQKKNWRKLGEKHTQQFLDDMEWLHNLPPTFYVRATDHIPEMQIIIKKLLKKGFAYEKQGSVYFEIAKDRSYGKLSRLSASQMLSTANERGNNPDDPNKKDPLDFVLWQKAPLAPGPWPGRRTGGGAGEPSWDSPWGTGRPGWHIECSAMSTKYLGQPFTIHGGGGDLLFPHHESEIAQSENAFSRPMAQYWMHTGMLRYRGEKMSKSRGNLVLVENLKEEYNANTVRLMLFSHHYRTSWECTHKDLQQAKKLNAILQKVWTLQSGQGSRLNFSEERNTFFAAMNDDINTPKALGALKQLSQKMTNPPRQLAGGGQNITDAKAFLMEVFHILGLGMEF